MEKIKDRKGTIILYNSYGGRSLFSSKDGPKRIDDGQLDDSPLAGVPMAVKDDISTKGIRTSAASRILSNYKPTYDASVVEKLKDAGSIIIGKTNMAEVNISGSSESSFYGPCKNPWNIEYLAAGSSGGSAAAVAAEQAFFSLGSDSGGSIRQSAGYCGVVGIKPTYGRVSRFGLISCASSLEQIGTFGRSVSDCIAALDTIAGYDPKDATSLDEGKYNFSKFLNNDIKGMRIAIPKIYLDKGLDKSVYNKMMEAARTFAELGAIVDIFDLPNLQYALPAYCVIAYAEASSNLARYDGIRYGHRADEFEYLDDLYINSRNQGLGLEVKKAILWGNMVLSSDNYNEYFSKAQKVRTIIIESLEKAFESYDLIMGPTSPNTAPPLNLRGENALSNDY